MTLDRTAESQSLVFKALGHPVRLEIVKLLGSLGELCVCELVQKLNCDQTTVSKHLAVLKSAGVVSARKEGLNVYYRLRLVCTYEFIRCLEESAQSCRPRSICRLCSDAEPGKAQAPQAY